MVWGGGSHFVCIGKQAHVTTGFSRLAGESRGMQLNLKLKELRLRLKKDLNHFSHCVQSALNKREQFLLTFVNLVFIA